jgi:hypothetical protein
MDEFITLLPTHFDNDILKTLGLFRYNKKGNPESIKKAEETKIINQDTLSEEEQDERQDPDNGSNTNDTEEFSPQTARILRSGRKINISVNTLLAKYTDATKAQWKTLTVPHQPPTIPRKSSTKRIATIKTPNTPYYVCGRTVVRPRLISILNIYRTQRKQDKTRKELQNPVINHHSNLTGKASCI